MRIMILRRVSLERKLKVNVKKGKMAVLEKGKCRYSIRMNK